VKSIDIGHDIGLLGEVSIHTFLVLMMNMHHRYNTLEGTIEFSVNIEMIHIQQIEMWL
jgi:hypothetical protein